MFFSYLAFSFIEILLVITILSVVVGIVWYQIYLPSLHKVYLAKDGLNLARACLIDVLNYCQDHKGRNFSLDNLTNCKNQTSLYGFLTFQISNDICSREGLLEDNTKLIVKDSASEEFYIECTFFKNRASYKCEIKVNQKNE